MELWRVKIQQVIRSPTNKITTNTNDLCTPSSKRAVSGADFLDSGEEIHKQCRVLAQTKSILSGETHHKSSLAHGG